MSDEPVTAERPPPLGAPARWWWLDGPRLAVRVSRSLGFSLVDGHFLVAVRPIAAWLPPALGLVGLLAGSLTLGYERVFSEALWIVLLAVAVGFVGTGPACWFVAGFAVGDFFLGQPDLTYSSFRGGLLDDGVLAGLLRLKVPMLIGYLLLAALVVLLPRLSRALIADIPRAKSLPRAASFAVAAVLNVVIVGIGVRLWAEASAVLVRPLFTWQSRRPTTEAVVTLQERVDVLVGVAVGATLVRYGLLWWQSASPARLAATVAVERDLAAGTGERPALERVPLPLRSLAVALTTTLLVAGVLDTWLVGLVVFAVFAAVRLVQDRVIPLPLEGWRRIVGRIPVLIRLAVALLVADTLRRAFVDEFAPTFVPLALFLAVTAVVLAALLPGPPQAAAPSSTVAGGRR